MLNLLHTLAADYSYSNNMDFSPDGEILATVGHSSRVVKLWDTRTGQEIQQLRTLGGSLYSVKFFGDGKRLLVGASLGCWLVDIRKGAIASYPKTGATTGALLLDDQHRFVTYGRSGQLGFWNLASKEPVFLSKAYKWSWSPIAVGGRYCAIGSGGAISIWDTDSHDEILFLREHTMPVKGLAISPDGKTLVSGGEDRRILFWDVATGEVTGEIRLEKGQKVRSLTFLGQGNVLACTCERLGLSLWNTDTHKLITATEIPSHLIPYWIATSQSTPLIAGAVGHGGVVMVWSAELAKGQFIPRNTETEPRKKTKIVTETDAIKALYLKLCSNNADTRDKAAHEILTEYTLSEETIGALASVQPLSDEVAEFFAKKLGSKSYGSASTALSALLGLPTKKRDAWIPTLLKHLKRFEDNSEWTWIVERLVDHYDNHRDAINKVLREGLKSTYAFGPYSVLKVLRELGTKVAELIPDVILYIENQNAFGGDEPVLIHLDPTGKKAIPALIEILQKGSDYAAGHATNELAAYGSIASDAITVLTELAESKNKDRAVAAISAKRALEAITPSRSPEPTTKRKRK